MICMKVQFIASKFPLVFCKAMLFFGRSGVVRCQLVDSVQVAGRISFGRSTYV